MIIYVKSLHMICFIIKKMHMSGVWVNPVYGLTAVCTELYIII